MADTEREPTPAGEEPEPEVLLCLSCSVPLAPRDDFCPPCGAPASTMATAGGFETIRSWAWALEASGRWPWTRTASLLLAWAWAAVELWLAYLVIWELCARSRLAGWLFLIPLGPWVVVVLLVVRHVTRRWWRPPPEPEIAEPDDGGPDTPPPADVAP